MKPFRPTKFARAALVLALVVSGCSPRPPADDVLAKVGEVEITVADFKAECGRRIADGQPLPDRQVLLDQMIEHAALVQQARAAGVDRMPDVRRACEDILIARLKTVQLTPQLEAVQVRPEEIQAAYEQEKVRYTQPAKARLAILFMAVDPKAEAGQVAAARARAGDIRRQALALPEDVRGFGRLAADFSDDQITRYRGGDVGWLAQDAMEDRWPRTVIAAGFQLAKAGEVSEVLRAADGFYLVRKLDFRPASVTPLEQVGGAIRRRLLAEKRAAAEAEFLRQARAALPVQTDPARLAGAPYPNPTLAPAATNPPALPTAH